MEALQQFEELLLLQKKYLPITQGQIPKTCEEIVILCNILGMIYLKNGSLFFLFLESFQMALDLLKKAEVLSKNNLRLKAITCNNMACYYSRTKKVRSAVGFLESALAIEYKQLKEIEDSEGFEAALLIDNPSDAHLNLCVSLSDLGRHEQALQHAMQALVFIQNEIIERTHLGKPSKSKESKEEAPKDQEKALPKEEEKGKEETAKGKGKEEQAKGKGKEKEEQPKEKGKTKKEELPKEGGGLLKPLKDRHAVLCIAYHNIAVQHECLINVNRAM